MRRPRLRLRTALILVALVAVILAVMPSFFRKRGQHAPGTWFGDGAFCSLWMPDGSVAVVTRDRFDGVLAEYNRQAMARWYLRVAPFPAEIRTWMANGPAGAIAAQTQAPGRTP